MAVKKFTAKVETGERGRVFITIPFDPHSEWGKKARHYVRGTIQDVPYSGSLGVRGSVFMPLNKEVRDKANISPGDVVKVTMEPDESPARELPDDFNDALEQSAAAREFFETLSPFYRNEYLKWIDSSKPGSQTRTARIQKTIELLEQRQKKR